jgi:hypothetical protein
MPLFFRLLFFPGSCSFSLLLLCFSLLFFQAAAPSASRFILPDLQIWSAEAAS